MNKLWTAKALQGFNGGLLKKKESGGILFYMIETIGLERGYLNGENLCIGYECTHTGALCCGMFWR